MAQVYELNLRDYWRIIRKRKFMITLVVAIVTLSTTFYVNLQTPLYRAMASVRLDFKRMVNIGLPSQAYEYSEVGNPLVTEGNIIKSRPIAEEAAKRLKLITADTSKDKQENIIDEIQNSISTEQIPDTNIIAIIVTSTDSQWAADVASQIAQVYVEDNLRRKSKKATQVRAYLEKQLNKVETQLTSAEEQRKKFKETQAVTGIAIPLENKLVELRTQLSDLLTKATEKHPQVIRLKEQIQNLQEQVKAMPSSELEFARLTRDVQVSEKLYTMLRERFEESRISEAENIGDATVVSLATVPKNPFNINSKIGILFGSLLGLMFGFVVAFIMESLDTSIGTIEDVESLLNINVLSVIPHIKFDLTKKKTSLLDELLWKRIAQPSEIDEGKVRLVAHFQPKSPAAEAYRTLRTNIQFTEQRKSLVISSAGPKEGKSSVLINLGVTAAQMGSKTLLVSTDLRKPSIYHTFGLKREPGLYEVLSGAVSLEKALRGLPDFLMGKIGFDEVLKTPGLDNLKILTTGHLASNPAELLSSKEMTNLIKEVRDKFDIILYDSPPILPITDAAILSSQCDGVILVYEVGRTARSALLRSKRQLESVGCKIIGIVLNHVRQETTIDTTYHYYHYRYYGRKKEPSTV